MAATRNLPRPVTTTELYLAAILDELQKQPQPELPPGKTVLKELPVVVSSAIPPTFPGVKALNEAGIYDYDDIPRTEAGLLAIRGIGAATAEAILNAI